MNYTRLLDYLGDEVATLEGGSARLMSDAAEITAAGEIARETPVLIPRTSPSAFMINPPKAIDSVGMFVS